MPKLPSPTPSVAAGYSPLCAHALCANVNAHVVVADLLADLVARGLRYDHGILAVSDGAEALGTAVAKVFGDRAWCSAAPSIMPSSGLCRVGLALWGWADRPCPPIVHRSDLPRLPTTVPRALTPNVDRDLMAAVDHLADPAARCAIRILRGTGMRIGELLDLELDCLVDYQSHGTWLRVPLGKLNTERTVPLDDTTLAVFDEWATIRGRSRPLLHPRTRRPVEFLWIINGRRMGAGRIRRGLDLAAASAGIGHVHPHRRLVHARPVRNHGSGEEVVIHCAVLARLVARDRTPSRRSALGGRRARGAHARS